jgi:hypothetical protein
MKNRVGFVSNSSSSSFVIIGEKLDFLPNEFEKDLLGVGSYCDEGVDIFPITKELFELIKKSIELEGNLEFYKGKGYDAEAGGIIKKSSLPDKFSVFGFQKDYYCTNSVNDLLERYNNE